LLMLPRVPESKSEHERKIDWPGLILAAIGLVLLLLGINQLSKTESLLAPAVVIPLGCGILSLLILFVYDSRCRYPTLQVSLFKTPAVMAGVLLALTIFFVQGGVLFQINLYLQLFLRMPPLQAAFYILPLALASFTVSLFSGQLLRRLSLLVIAPAAL